MYVDIHRYVVRVWGKVDVFSDQKQSLPIDQVYTYISCFPFGPTYVKSKGIKPLLLKILLLSTKVYMGEFGNWEKFSYIYSKLTLMKKSELREIIKEEISKVLNESSYFQLLDKIEKLDAKILNSENVKAKEEWVERRGEIIGQYGDDGGWDGMGNGDLQTAIEDAEETIDFYDIKKIKEMKKSELSQLILEIIKESINEAQLGRYTVLVWHEHTKSWESEDDTQLPPDFKSYYKAKRYAESRYKDDKDYSWAVFDDKHVTEYPILVVGEKNEED